MARTPRSKEQTGKRSAKVRQRAPNALAVTVFLLLLATGGLAAWLSYSYEPPVDRSQTLDAVLPIDLSKEGRGKQPAPEMAAKPAAKPAHEDKERPPAPPAKMEADKMPAGQDSHAPAGGQDAMAPAPARDSAEGAPGSEASQPQVSPAPAVSPRPMPRVFPDKDQRDEAAHGEGAKSGGETGHGAPAMQDGGLPPAPDPALIKSTEDGPLPMVAPDGRTPLQVYARPYKATGRPRVALVVGSLGLSQATTVAAIQQLPGGVTLAFAPYGRNLQDYVNQARAAGHEVLLQVPMEPMDYPTNDPGPHTLLTSLTINKNLKRLNWLLGRFTGYVGVVNYMGGRFTTAESHIRPILEALRDRGLMFLDARASSSSVVSDLAGKIGLTVAANDRVIDLIASRAAIDARLLELERLASASGGAIGIGFPYPVTIERLAQWTRALGERGFDLVPISALADHQEAKP